jgi:uncharacterized SAM-binding protein YcdF (DUF218 family)
MKNFYLLGFLFLVIVLVIAFRQRILLAVGDFLVVQDELHPADAIHVIAGDDYRTDYAIQLYKQGYARRIFFTGGWCRFHGYYHGLHGQEVSLAQGVLPQDIAFDETTVISTYDEAERLKEWIDQSPVPIRSVIVVSDPFHMRRARWTYRKILGNSVEVQMAPVPFSQTPFQRVWWTDRASRKYVEDEYKKYAYYLARYQYSWGRLQKWLVSLDSE